MVCPDDRPPRECAAVKCGCPRPRRQRQHRSTSAADFGNLCRL